MNPSVQVVTPLIPLFYNGIRLPDVRSPVFQLSMRALGVVGQHEMTDAPYEIMLGFIFLLSFLNIKAMQAKHIVHIFGTAKQQTVPLPHFFVFFLHLFLFCGRILLIIQISSLGGTTI